MTKHGADSPERSALLLSPEAPYPPAGGGALRTASLIEYLGPRYALDVIVFREPGAADPRDAFPPGLARGVHVIDLPRHSKSPAARAVRNLVRLAAGSPPLNDRFRGFTRELTAALGERRYDLAVIEHFWCAPYLDVLAPHAARVVLDLHNLESALYRGLAQSEPWPASLALTRFAAAARRLEGRPLDDGGRDQNQPPYAALPRLLARHPHAIHVDAADGVWSHAGGGKGRMNDGIGAFECLSQGGGVAYVAANVFHRRRARPIGPLGRIEDANRDAVLVEASRHVRPQKPRPAGDEDPFQCHRSSISTRRRCGLRRPRSRGIRPTTNWSSAEEDEAAPTAARPHAGAFAGWIPQCVR